MHPGLEDERAVAEALGAMERELDVADADALHLARRGDAERFVTFDRRLARRAAAVDPV